MPYCLPEEHHRKKTFRAPSTPPGGFACHRFQEFAKCAHPSLYPRTQHEHDLLVCIRKQMMQT